MFGLGVGEILLILGLALIFIGPERLPDLARSLARGYAEFRRSFDEVKNTIDKDIRSLQADELLREGKPFPLDATKNAPWAEYPGKLTPPQAAPVEEADVVAPPAPAAPAKSNPVPAEQSHEQ